LTGTDSVAANPMARKYFLGEQFRLD